MFQYGHVGTSFSGPNRSFRIDFNVSFFSVPSIIVTWNAGVSSDNLTYSFSPSIYSSTNSSFKVRLIGVGTGIPALDTTTSGYVEWRAVGYST